ncbi:hypothetical protein SS37A_26120 [Methylocystis iwaonis]|uniref:Uncharacterized protein n=1 Tax=Methylocystis iwaonis TaxID=2885079 RepID=A0ABN6VHA3_9HYPH|nr:hypothetical protein SS37A_26120 [Methylocystis iwaonis]
MSRSLGGKFLAGEQKARFGVLQAGRDAVDWRFGVKWQPCGASLRDGELRDEGIDPARHPKTHDAARTDAKGEQPSAEGVRSGVKLPIADGMT